MNCPLCAAPRLTLLYRADDWEYGTRADVSFARCAACGLIIQSPLPSKNAIPFFYPPHYRYYTRGSRLFRFLKEIEFRRLAYFIATLIPRDAAVLEIGCGRGELLLALKERGFEDLAGSDVSGTGRELLAKADISFVQINADDMFPSTNSFDLIIMNNTFEHFRDPLNVLANAEEHLLPGGKIFLVTPNTDSIARAMFGRFWAGLHTPRHLWLFSISSMSKAAEHTNLSLTIARRLPDPGGWAISLQNIIRRIFSRRPPTNGLSRYTLVFMILAAPFALLESLFGRPGSIAYILMRYEK